MNLVADAALRAAILHSDQWYGEVPYIIHLSDVVKVLRKYHYDDVNMLAAGFLHDVIEDCGISTDWLTRSFNKEVSLLVDAVSGEGHNRKERKANMIAKLYNYPKAIPLKMADRMANIQNCIDNNPRLLEMYTKEMGDYAALFASANQAMYIDLCTLTKR